VRSGAPARRADPPVLAYQTHYMAQPAVSYQTSTPCRAQDEAGESLLTTVTACSWVDEHATTIGAPAHGLAASEIEGRHQLCIYTRVGRWQTGRPPTHTLMTRLMRSGDYILASLFPCAWHACWCTREVSAETRSAAPAPRRGLLALGVISSRGGGHEAERGAHPRGLG